MPRSSLLHRALAAPIGLALGIAFVGVAVAQDAAADDPVDSSDEIIEDVVVSAPIISTSADGAFVESTSGVNPVAEGGGGTLVYGDITGGVPAVPIVNSPAPAQPGNNRQPEPSEPEPSEPAPSEPAPAPAPPAPAPATSAADQDGDNINDADEPALGLDPTNIDTDGDFIDDGYELNGLGTDPTLFDTDGDGRGDGEEVYGSFTDPLVPDGGPAAPPAPPVLAAPAPAAAPGPAPASAPISIPGATGPISATEGDASTRGPGAAEADPGTISSPSVSEQTVPLTEAAPFATSSCGDFGSWYDAQLGYESAGRLTAPDGLVSALDPDFDGIACEERMI